MRVVVSEDLLLTRVGIVRLLQDAGVEVVAEATDLPETLEAVALHLARQDDVFLATDLDVDQVRTARLHQRDFQWAIRNLDRNRFDGRPIDHCGHQAVLA